jgi:UDP-2,4-diacetamido-2,4,6-trideoxy-beta-L-altropyranose hydrolase
VSGPTLLIRADATATIGTGHVVRCLVLARAWRERTAGRAVLATVAPVGPLAARVAAAGVEVRQIDAADATATAEAARDEDAAWVALDGYGFDEAYQHVVAGAGRPVLVLDDHGHAGAYRADLVLNQNFGATAAPYAASVAAERLLLGPRFALVAPEFAGVRAPDPPPRARRVLVTLGGSDPDGATAVVVEALALARPADLEATVVAGPANPRVEALREAVDVLGAGAELVVDADDMPRRMAAAELAVAAAGGTARELALVGVPSLLLTLAENQRPAAEAMAALGVAVDLGWSHAADPETIATALHALAGEPARRAAMVARGRAQIDGRGAGRVVAAMAATGRLAA